jgi:hypothetical protein
MAALVAAMGRLGPCERDGQGGGGRRRRAVVGWRLSAAQHRPPSAAVGGELGPLVVVEAEGVESLVRALPTERPYLMRGAPRGRGRATQHDSIRRGSRE